MITKRWFKGDSYIQIQEILAGEDWSILHSLDAESSANHLIEKIQEAMDIVAPVETKELKKKPINQWTTPGIKISLKKASKLYRKYRSSRKTADKIEYKTYKKVLEAVIRKSKDLYYGNTIQEAKEDTRKLWSILNEMINRKQCRHKMPNKFIIDGKSVKNKKNIANAFNVYFASIGTDMAAKLPTTEGYEEYLQLPEIEKIPAEGDG